MQYDIGCLQLFAVGGSLNHRDHLRHDSVPLNTFHKGQLLPTEYVEENVFTVLHSRFVFVLDGQSIPGTHYVAVFASYLSSKAAGFSNICLVLSPMKDETTKRVDEQTTFLKLVLEVFRKLFLNFKALKWKN